MIDDLGPVRALPIGTVLTNGKDSVTLIERTAPARYPRRISLAFRVTSTGKSCHYYGIGLAKILSAGSWWVDSLPAGNAGNARA